MLSFFEMEMKFGPAMAYHCLTEMEKVANIASWQVAEIDPETRLTNAICAQDAAHTTMRAAA